MVFWIMLIWIMAVGYLFQANMSYTILEKDGNYSYYPRKAFCVLLWVVPLLFICLCSSFGDRAAYINHFNNSPLNWDEVGLYASNWEDSRLFYYLQALFKIVISKNAYIWLAVISIIQAICMTKVLRKYSVNYAMSMFVFIASSMMISWMCNGVRQFIAVSILFLCTDWILNGNWIKYYCVAFILMGAYPIARVIGIENIPWLFGGVHQSALIVFPIYFCIRGKMLNKKMWMMLVAIIVVALFGGITGAIENVASYTVFEKDFTIGLYSSGINPMRFLVACVPVLLVVFRIRHFDQDEIPGIIHLSVNASVVTAVLYAISMISHGSLIGRLPIYTEMYNLILIPWLIENIYQRNLLLRIGLHAGYMMLFFYQINIAWANSPYISTILHIG